jgi:predicted CXXCH cytochrome family protein
MWAGFSLITIVAGVMLAGFFGRQELFQERVIAADGLQRPAPLADPDAVCAGCHREIYARYERTPMARGSGVAMDGLLPGGFHHGPSGIDYRVFRRDGAAWMSFDRRGQGEANELKGERRLLYFIGSGHLGRTYLYEVDGQWFELPINYYSGRAGWDMAPKFGGAKNMPEALPVDPNCLHCHATGVEPSLPSAKNRFADGPFRQGGVGCGACHGSPAEHLAKEGRGAIVNPAKLSAARRDSTCLQCHLEGDVVVYRAGRSLAQFEAGDDLSDAAVYFVWASQQAGGARATSQYEALLRSACKRGSGDRLTCTTCHDPHGSPSPAERVQYFRGKCLSCHTGAKMATSHHAEQPNCAVCHMPSRNAADISHEQVTDHNIESRPEMLAVSGRVSMKDGEELVPVGGVRVGDRELGMAYAQLAERGDRRAGETALRLLTRAEQMGVSDEQMEVQLGFLEQMSGQAAKARADYTEALNADPYEPSALANLAALDAGSGRVDEAVRLLKRLTEADVSEVSAGLNLAFIDCKLGRQSEALDLTRRLLWLNPDDPQLREFLSSGRYGGDHCSVR